MVELNNKCLSGVQNSFERHADLLGIQKALNVNGGDESANESA